MEESRIFEQRIAGRIKARRRGMGLTLEGLSSASGVSRAMISRIERGEASPTAALLDRVAAALETTIGQLVSPDTDGDVARGDSRPSWTDPATGYDRRQISPAGTGSPVEIVEVTFPPGARVSFTGFRNRNIDQHVWVLDGQLELTVGDVVHLLTAGDCVHHTLKLPVGFRNISDVPVRYAVVLHRKETQ